MLKRIFFLANFLLPAFILRAQSPGNHLPVVKWEGESFNGILTVEFPEWNSRLLPDGTEILSCPGCRPHLKEGFPDLHQFAVPLQLPEGADVEFSVEIRALDDIGNHSVAISQGNTYRVSPENRGRGIPSPETEKYSIWPPFPVDVGNPFVWRDLRGQVIYINPFMYFPATGQTMFIRKIRIEIFPADGPPVNPLLAKPSVHRPREWKSAMQNRFVNTASQQPLYPVMGDESAGAMLVIVPSSFVPVIQPLVEWKKQKGMQVEVVNADSLADAEQIKNLVNDRYLSDGISFLLLVGDHAQVPTYPGIYGDSDNEYTYLQGIDLYPEIMVGRLSGETSSEIEVQVNRILRYEKNPPLAGDFYRTAIGVASEIGPGDDGELDYQHLRNIRTELMDTVYSTVAELYDGSQGGEDAVGNPTKLMLLDAVNAGAGLINYTGHGTDISCTTTGFTLQEVAGLTNADAYPFYIAVGCSNGNFTSTTCLAEAWMRAGSDDPQTPYGAIATLMSTNGQSWDPPMEAQDEMNALIAGKIPGVNVHSLGAIAMNGLMKMIDTYGPDGEETAETWNFFGDPSVMLRTQQPLVLSATHVQAMDSLTEVLTVTCNREGALVCLSRDGEPLSVAEVNGGMAELNFPRQAGADLLLVTVTGWNCIPYTGTVELKAAPVASDFTVWPNPFRDELGMKWEGTGVVRVSVYAVTGQKVGELAFKAGVEQQLDTEQLSRGIYWMRVETAEGTSVHRLVKN